MDGMGGDVAGIEDIFGAEICSQDAPVFVRIHQRIDNMSQLSASRVLPRQVQFVDSWGPASFIIQEVFLTVESV